jgi:hypothetical protein
MDLLETIGAWQFWLLLGGATIGCDSGASSVAVLASGLLFSIGAFVALRYIIDLITAQTGETTKDN